MSSNKRVLILAGDGIGPEVMRQVERVMEWLSARRSISFDVSRGLVGGACYEAHGTPLTDETMADALAGAIRQAVEHLAIGAVEQIIVEGADGVLLVAAGGQEWTMIVRARRTVGLGLLRLEMRRAWERLEGREG